MKKLLCLLLSCALCAAMAACGENSPAPQESPAPETPVEQAAPEQAAPEEAAPEEAAPEAEESETAEDTRGIPGSDYLEITLNLEKNGFPRHTAQRIEEDDCMFIFEQDGSLAYRLVYLPVAGKGDASGQIISGTFSVMNTEGLDDATFLAGAENFLAFCASFTYDTADVETVQQWVKDNIQAAGLIRENKQIETTIGDVKFTLSGTTMASGLSGSRDLHIEKVEAE